MNRKATAIISARTAEIAANHTVRWSSLGVLGLSFVGSIIAFNGSWPNTWFFWNQLSIVAVIAGIILQAFCTVLQWGFRDSRKDPRYFVPLAVDAGATYIGYSPLLVPVLAAAVGRSGLPELVTLTVGHVAVILLGILAAYYPEQTLIAD